MTFLELLERWEVEVQSLRTTMPINYLVTASMHRERKKELKQFIEQNCTVEHKTSDDDFEYIVPPEVYNSYKKITTRMDRLEVGMELIPRMFITTLICQYDALVGDLARLVMISKPEILNNSERQLSFKDIVDFGTMEKAKEYIIAKEIETLLRKSHKEQINWFEKKLEINLCSDIKLLTNFYEITERRNVFTHNNGIVNDCYINNCKQLGCKVTNTLGQRLDVTEKYFINSVDCLLEIGSKLTTILWRVLFPEDNEKTEIAINNLAFNLISEKNYDLAITMLNFALGFKGLKNANKLMLNINLAQCYLWKGDDSKCKKILELQDWSVSNPELDICRYVLERKYSDAIYILQTTPTEIQQNDLLEWPIFKELRKESSFKEFFSRKYSMTMDEYKRHFSYTSEKKDAKDKQKQLNETGSNENCASIIGDLNG